MPELLVTFAQAEDEPDGDLPSHAEQEALGGPRGAEPRGPPTFHFGLLAVRGGVAIRFRVYERIVCGFRSELDARRLSLT